MRIAQVAPLTERVPPVTYGGTERVVSYLTEELVRLGHDVTLFASGDSITAAELHGCCEQSLRLDPSCADPLAHHVRMLEWVRQREQEFDIVHCHVDYLHYSQVRRSPTPHLTTLHGRLDRPDLRPLYEEFDDVPLVSISHAQRQPLPWVNWVGTVPHGLPPDLYTCHEQPGKYLAFVGRASPEKGLERAIEIALRAGMVLRIAAKVDVVDQAYFDDSIRPLLSHPGIEFIGEISEQQKSDFLGNALASMFQIDWPEPFGLAMIESMACGTPVIARRRGSVPEVIDEGVTGFIVEEIDDAVAAIEAAAGIDRLRCRETFERRFSAERMALDYVDIYRSMHKPRCIDEPVVETSAWAARRK